MTMQDDLRDKQESKMLDIPEHLQARAEKLEARIIEENPWIPDLDCGPFTLICAKTGYHIWEGGLPLEGIVDALDCLEREWASGNVEASWRDFGHGWTEQINTLANSAPACK